MPADTGFDPNRAPITDIVDDSGREVVWKAEFHIVRSPVERLMMFGHELLERVRIRRYQPPAEIFRLDDYRHSEDDDIY